MFAQTITIDHTGRVTLPRQVLEALGIQPSAGIEAIIELSKVGVVIRPRTATAPVTACIAAMDLPVADWEQMEQEIDAERLE